MATTHIYNKLQDTSIYINLSSQNLHSAIAALKQEAKPLTTLNIKGFGDTKRGSKRQGNRQEMRQRWWWWWGARGQERDRNRWEWQDRVTGSCQGLKDVSFLGFLKRGHEFDVVYKCFHVNYSAPWVDMVTFKCKYSFFIWFKGNKRKKKATVF